MSKNAYDTKQNQFHNYLNNLPTSNLHVDPTACFQDLVLFLVTTVFAANGCMINGLDGRCVEGASFVHLFVTGSTSPHDGTVTVTKSRNSSGKQAEPGLCIPPLKNRLEVKTNYKNKITQNL